MIDSISGDETAPRTREKERFQISVDARHFPTFFFDEEQRRATTSDDDEERNLLVTDG